MEGDLVVLLPPSEGKAPGGGRHWRARTGAFAGLAPARRDVVRAYVAALAGPAAERVVGGRGDVLDRALDAGRLLARGRAPSLPACARFTGVVWEHLHPADLPVERIAVVSALCGVVAGDDPVPDHRLKLSVTLPPLGRLDRFWRPRVAPAIERWAAGREVWDLLPLEHAAAVDFDLLPRVVRVRFEGIGGHEAKAVKGAFARHLLRTGGHGRFGVRGWSVRRTGNVVAVSRR